MTTYLTHVISDDEHKRLAGDRKRLREGTLGADDIALLDAISPGWSLSEFDHSWNRKAVASVDFYGHEGKNPFAESELGQWLVRQRKSLRSDALRSDRRAWLDENYPTWSETLDTAWEKTARAATDFYKREGQHPIARSELGRWLANQRAALKNDALRSDRRAWLDENYPTWSETLDTVWEKTAHAAAIFYNCKGRHPKSVAGLPGEAELGVWLGRQRRALKKNTLRPDRLVWLSEHYPTWNDTYDTVWDQKARSALKFYDREGVHPSGVLGSSHEAELSRWMGTQRANLKNGTLRPDRRAWLDEHYPTWNETLDDVWYRTAHAVADFYNCEGHRPSRTSKEPAEKELGEWVSTQRANLKNGTLRPDRRAWLDEHYPTWNETRDDVWYRTAHAVADFYTYEGRHPKATTEGGLKYWLDDQRKAMRDETLRPDRRAWLDEHYPTWANTRP